MSFKETELGKIPSEWSLSTLGNALYIKGRIGWKGLKKDEYLEKSDFRIINGLSIIDNKIDWEKCGYISEERYHESPEIMLKKNDIVMTKDGTIGKIAIIPDLSMETSVASGLFVIRVITEEIDFKYLYYYFNSHYFKKLINSRIEGSVIPHLYQRDLVDLKVPLPKIKEQKAIARLLSKIDDKIEVNNKINKTLEEIAHTIFKQWFIDFEFPNKNGEPYKSNSGEMVESELGMIPIGWEVVSLFDLAEYINGTSFKKGEINENVGIPIIKIAELKNGFSDSTKYLNDYSTKSEKYFLKNGDILFSWSGNPETSIDTFIWYRGEGVLNQHIFKVEPYKLSKGFIFLILKEFKSTFKDIASNKQTTGLGHVTISDLKRLKIVLPNEADIRRLTNNIEGLIKEIHVKDLENMKLAKLRDTLLPKLISGEIRVPLNEESVLL